MEAALKSVAANYGVKITPGNCTFNADLATMKVEIAAIKEDGKVSNRFEQDFIRHHRYYGLNLSDLGRKFRNPMSNMEFTITGINDNSEKYPIMGRGVVDGKDYKFPKDLVLRALRLQDAEKAMFTAIAKQNPRRDITFEADDANLNPRRDITLDVAVDLANKL
jgi:hypothetical protein